MSTINEYNRYSESPTLTNKTPDYNQMYNFSRPTKVQDFINNKNNIVHNELYNFALKRFIDDHVSSNVTNNMIVNIFDWLNSVIVHIVCAPYLNLSSYSCCCFSPSRRKRFR